MKYNLERAFKALCVAVIIGEGIAAAAIMIGGCGQGQSNRSAVVNPADISRALGQANFTIYWPQPTRVLPLGAASVKISVEQIDPQTGQWVQAADPQIVPRPSTPGASSVHFTGLPVATLRFTAAAYPNADGSGVAQAVGMGELATEDVSVPHDVPITMDSTVVRVTATPTTASVAKGAGIAVMVTAYDKSNRIVLTAPSAWHWESGAPSIVLAPTGGSVDGRAGQSPISAILNTVAPGTATITVSYTEGPGGDASTAKSVITVTDTPAPAPCGFGTACTRPNPPNEQPCRFISCNANDPGFINGCGQCVPLPK